MAPRTTSITAARIVPALAAVLAGAVGAALAAEPALAAEAVKPAGGAATGQVVGATAGALAVTAGLIWLLSRHRAGRGTVLRRLSAHAERISGLPGWAALPAALAAAALLVALLGMYWDIALHAGQGRDQGPLANPAHYLILAGLFGVFAAGCLAIALPVGERPGPAAVRIAGDWHAPVGGVLIAACGAFALTGFPLDDVWHRLFGQDVTLWGPTHLMLIGGAGMTLIGQAVLVAEGMRARDLARPRDAARNGDRRSAAAGARPGLPLVTQLRRIGLMGGLLIGLSTFQAEFDFGIPQFSLVFHPMLIALASGVALVAARIWIGPGGALAATAFFLAVRGAVSLAVGPVLGEAAPTLPLYLGEALSIELAALAIGTARPLLFGAAGGLLAGTAGFWSEWVWTGLVMPIPWSGAMLPEAPMVAAAAGTAGGLLGGLVGAALRGELPRPAVARATFAAALVATAALVANGLVTAHPAGVQARVTLADVRGEPERQALATVRVSPAAAAREAEWLTVTAWQGGGVKIDRLERVSDGVYRTSRPVPLHGDWKSMVRLHGGRALMGVPLFLPEDRGIPAAEVPAPHRLTREFQPDREILQRESRVGASGSLWTVASLVVLALAVSFVLALAWGLARLARAPRAAAPPAAPPGVPQPAPPLTGRAGGRAMTEAAPGGR